MSFAQPLDTTFGRGTGFLSPSISLRIDLSKGSGLLPGDLGGNFGRAGGGGSAGKRDGWG